MDVPVYMAFQAIFWIGVTLTGCFVAIIILAAYAGVSPLGMQCPKPPEIDPRISQHIEP
jgi:hypothetical protein